MADQGGSSKNKLDPQAQSSTASKKQKTAATPVAQLSLPPAHPLPGAVPASPANFKTNEYWNLVPIGSLYCAVNNVLLNEYQHQVSGNNSERFSSPVAFQKLLPLRQETAETDSKTLVRALQASVLNLFGLKEANHELSLPDLLEMASSASNYEVVRFESIANPVTAKFQQLASRLFGVDREVCTCHGTSAASAESIKHRQLVIGMRRAVFGYGVYTAATNKKDERQPYGVFHAACHAPRDPLTGEQTILICSTLVPDEVSVGTKDEHDVGTVHVEGKGEVQRAISANGQMTMVIASNDNMVVPVAVLVLKYKIERQLTVEQYHHVRFFERSLWEHLRSDPRSIVFRSKPGPVHRPPPQPAVRMPTGPALTALLASQPALAASAVGASQPALAASAVGAQQVNSSRAAALAGPSVPYVPPVRTSVLKGNAVRRNGVKIILSVGDWVRLFNPFVNANIFMKDCCGVIKRITSPHQQKLEYDVEFRGDAAFNAHIVKTVGKRYVIPDAGRNIAHLVCTVGELEPCPVSTVVYTMHGDNVAPGPVPAPLRREGNITAAAASAAPKP